MSFVDALCRPLLHLRTQLRWLRLRSRTLDYFSVPAPAGLVLLDCDLRVVRANDAIAAMVGVSPDQMIGQQPTTLVPKIAPLVEPILRSVASTGVPALNFPVAGETPAQPGVTRYWKVSIFAIKEWGRHAGFMGAIVVEVSSQVQLQLLAEAETLAGLGSWEWDLLTGAVTCSLNLRRLLGIDLGRAQFSVQQLRERIHPEDRESVKTVTKSAIKDRQPYEYYARFLLPDGRVRTLYTRGRPVFESPNLFVKLVGVTQDVTEKLEAERALIASEERYRDLIENSQDLICTHDLDGTVTWMNDLPAKILGYSAKQLIGHRIPELLAPETRDEFANYIKQIRTTGRAEGVMQLVARSGERRFWEYRNTLRTEGVPSPIVRGMAHDITERRRAQDALRKQEKLVRNLFDTAQRLTMTLDLDTILDLLNFQAMNLTEAMGACAGLRRAEGFSCDSFYENRTRKKIAFTWPPGVGIPGWVLENKRTYRTNSAESDPLIPSEVRRSLSLTSVLCVPVFDIPHEEVIAFLALHNKRGGFEQADIDTAEGISGVASIAIQNSLTYEAVCQKEGELHRLSSQLISSQDAERRQIAQELNEQTAQDLTGLKMALGALRDSCCISSESGADIHFCQGIIDKVLTELRTLSYSLHPQLLEMTGLRLAIGSYVKAFSRATGIMVQMEIPEDLGRFRQAEETTIYRIVQEALTNISLQSEGKTARIYLARESDCIRLEIEDSGKGTPMKNRPVSLGVGLMGITERVRLHGGNIQINSFPEKGFTVRIQFPIQSKAKAAAGGAEDVRTSEVPRLDCR